MKRVTHRHLRVLSVGLLLALSLTGCSSGAQPLAIWSGQSGTAQDDAFSAVLLASQGALVVGGTTSGDLFGANAGYDDIVLARYDTSGAVVWSKQIGSPGSDGLVAMCASAAGDLYVAGQTDGNLYGTALGSEDVVLIKLSPAGDVLWGRQFGTAGMDYPLGAAVDGSGSIYVVGCTDGSLAGEKAEGERFDGFLVKYDGDGNRLWGRQLGATDTSFSLNGLALDSQGNIYVCGMGSKLFPPDHGQVDALVAKYSSSGELVWGKQFGKSHLTGASAIAVSGADGIYVGGALETGDESDGFSSKAYVAKFDSGGNQTWLSELIADGRNDVAGLSLDDQGYIYAVGKTRGDLFGASAGGFDAFLAKYDPSGTRVWGYQFGTGPDQLDAAVSVVVDQNGVICVAGTTTGSLYGSNLGEGDGFLVKFSQ